MDTIANIAQSRFAVNLFLKIAKGDGCQPVQRQPQQGRQQDSRQPPTATAAAAVPVSMFSFHRTAHSAPGFWHFRTTAPPERAKALLLPPPSNSSSPSTSTPPAVRTSASVQTSIYWGFAAVLGIPGTPQTRLCLIRLIPESESDVFFEIPKNRT